MLIGAPGVGKSTWIKQNLAHDFRLVSSDQYIESAAVAAGKTYGEVFDANIKQATAAMYAELNDALTNNENIVWDQTNLTVKSRKGKLDQLPMLYKKIAVAFEIQPDEHAARRAERKQTSGKDVPSHIINSMLQQYQRPTVGEGFDEVIVVTG